MYFISFQIILKNIAGVDEDQIISELFNNNETSDDSITHNEDFLELSKQKKSQAESRKR